VLRVPAGQTSGRRGGCLAARYLLRSYLTSPGYTAWLEVVI
jgi:hypothetical protein